MEKVIHNNAKFIDYMNWSFPSIELEKNDVTEKDNNAEQVAALHSEIARLKSDLDNMKHEYHTKATAINNVFSNLENFMKFADDHILSVIKNIIVKCTKKIIQKEIILDANILREILNQAQALLHEDAKKIRIYLSVKDAELVMSEKLNELIVIIPDINLEQGDIYIKSEGADINGILEKRIDLLLGIDNG